MARSPRTSTAPPPPAAPPRTPLTPGPLRVSAPLRDLLAAAAAFAAGHPERARELTPHPRTLPLSELQAIEAELDVELPHDVLALVALGVPIFERAAGLSLSRFALNHDAPPMDKWRAIGSAEVGDMHPDHEPTATDQGVNGLTIFARARAPRDGDPKVLALDDQGERVGLPRPLSRFLRERLAIRYPGPWPSPVPTPMFALLVIDDRPPPLAIPVTHPTFGAGAITKILDGGKVEATFATGPRTLLRKFLREA
jgi:hypothetical protein